MRARPSFPDLRPIREQRQKLLAEYADRLGITEGHLSRIERGLVESIPVELAWGIRRVYGVPLKAWDRGVGRPAAKAAA